MNKIKQSKLTQNKQKKKKQDKTIESAHKCKNTCIFTYQNAIKAQNCNSYINL